MRLERLKIENYRSFEALEIEFHKQLTVLAGVNGAGKTSLLEATAVAIGTLFTGLDGISGNKIIRSDAHMKAYKLGSSKDVQSLYPVVIDAYGSMNGTSLNWKRSLNSSSGKTTTIDAKNLIDISKEYQERLRKGDETLILPVIAYYATNRLWDYHRESEKYSNRVNTRTNGYLTSLDGTANIKLMMNWFKGMTEEQLQRVQVGEDSFIPEFKAVCLAIERCFTLVTGYKDVKIQYRLMDNDIEISYIDLDEMKMRISLDQLSAGFKGTLCLIADIAYRMAVLNPQLLENVLTSPGVVLIDEIDLHLHPSWQKRVLQDLMDIFPNVQFIVTTHAPAVINSVHSENLLLLENNQVLSLQHQVYGKDVNSVLKEIMGVQVRPNDVSEMFKQYYELVDQEKFDEAEQKLEEINVIRGYHDPEVVYCKSKLRLERLRSNKR